MRGALARCAVFLAALAASAGTGADAAPELPARASTAVSALDDRGERVALARPATRVLTLAPHATELVYAAGGGEAIIGTVEHSDYPPQAKALPRVGDAWALHPERVLALRPDLVVAWLPGPLAAVDPALRQAGIAVFHAAPTTLDGIADDVERLSHLLGSEASGLPAANAMRARIAALRERYAQRSPLRVFVQAGTEPLYTLNGGHVVSDALRTCGARNVFADALAAAPMVDPESVIATRPDALLLARDNTGADPAAPWRLLARHVPAVAENRLIVLPADDLYRPGPRLIEATASLCEALDALRR
ncbi:cobalamin-binding protein [Verticiella sediminum]|nr:cobalamin-binding protein [Verticiella sediminum]